MHIPAIIPPKLLTDALIKVMLPNVIIINGSVLAGPYFLLNIPKGGAQRTYGT